MDAAESTVREAWARVAHGAAGQSEAVRGDAIRHALGIPIDQIDIVDALLAGDPSLDHSEAVELIETERTRLDLMRHTFARLTTAWLTTI